MEKKDEHDVGIPKNIAETNDEDTKTSEDDISGLLELPREERRMIRSVMASVQMIQRTGTDTAVASKITEEHITQYLNGARENMQLEHRDKHQLRITTLIAMALIGLFLVVVILLLKDNPDVMEKIIYAVGGVLIGAVGGFGIGRYKQKD